MILKIDQLNINHEIDEGKMISIGRTGFGADIEINEPRVSSLHARVKLEEGQIRLFDSNSLNGVKINGRKIEPGIWTTISDNDEISISDLIVTFSPTKKTAPDAPATTTAEIDRKFRELLKQKLPITIGRLPANTIQLPDEVDNDRIVSRNHAELFYDEGRYWIKDLGSTNGTYVNNEKVESQKPRALENQDFILIHLHYFSLSSGYRDLREEVAIRAESIEKAYANGFIGLKRMSVEIPYKQIVALMGPSGCGKSTLLKTLNGDSPATSGNVFIHGLSLRENYNLLKTKIGYVPQDDTIHSELTVEKTLYLAAKLRLPDDTADDEIATRITSVLANLNFKDTIRSKRVGELSGGQRKRVCIAVELLSRPTILFLDEPTSPLDPETIEEFLISIKQLARNGTTIVMVTHKPEDLNYVDKVIFMAKEGYFVYYGDKGNLTETFNVENIVQVYSLCGGANFNYTDYYIKPAEKAIVRKAENNIVADKQHRLLRQFYWLSKRYAAIKLSDRYNLYLLLAQPLVIAALVGMIFHEVGVQVLMLVAISAVWFGVSNASKEIVGEFAVYKRERMFNLNIYTYIFSKWVVLSLISLVQVVIFMAVIHLRFARGANNILGGYWANILFMFYISASATIFGLFLSAYFKTTEKVLTMVPVALLPQIMLAGVVQQITNINVDVLSYFTLGRWGTEGLIRLQRGPFNPPFTLADLYYSQTLKDQGHGIATLFNSTGGNILAMTILNIVMFTLTYISLKRKDTI
jgi:ABC-type multidrug transport system ATPase subunit/pSer/pThr/pTyr-binding forkhead associated (FHA) protein